MRRNIGLDLIRSVAIILVLVCHGITIFYNPELFPATTTVILEKISAITGLFGVEVFFVLSGFLIGRIIIKDIVSSNDWSSLKVFYLRRWFRTLPLYYLMVFGFLLVTGRTHYWENLFFIQNFNEDHLDKFPVSWSLSVEEWFYLFIPVLFLISGTFIKNAKKSFFIVCFFVISFELLARVGYSILSNPTFNHDIRKQVYFRLDSIMVGVLLSGIYVYYRAIYDKIANSKMLFMVSSVLLMIGLAFMYKINDDVNNSFFAKTLYFTLNSIFIAISLSFIESHKAINTIKNPLFIKLIYIVSITSYASYLIHVYVFRGIEQFTHNYITNGISLILIWLVAVILVTVISYFIYKYFEEPVLKFRDKITISRREIPSKQSKEDIAG